MSNSNNNLRNSSIDALKGIMIILVVLGHITYIGELKNHFEHLRDYIYFFHMPIFLMITGYFINIKLSIKKITNNLLIPYILFFSTYLIILLITTKLNLLEKSNSIESISNIFHAIIFQPFASYWYLHSLILFCCILSISNYIGQLCFKKQNLSFTIIVFYLIQTIFVFFDFKLLYWVTSYIWIGMLYRITVSNSITTDSIASLSILTVASFFIQDFDLIRTITCVLIVFLIIFLLKRINHSMIALIGRNSLLIFLFHVYFINIMKAFSLSTLKIDSSGILFIILSLLISIFGSLLTGSIMDKIKISTFIFGTKKVIK